jgi:hypothetical protein
MNSSHGSVSGRRSASFTNPKTHNLCPTASLHELPRGGCYQLAPFMDSMLDAGIMVTNTGTGMLSTVMVQAQID